MIAEQQTKQRILKEKDNVMKDIEKMHKAQKIKNMILSGSRDLTNLFHLNFKKIDIFVA